MAGSRLCYCFLHMLIEVASSDSRHTFTNFVIVAQVALFIGELVKSFDLWCFDYCNLYWLHLCQQK